MFVQTNAVKAIKSYFKDRLKDDFSESEIKFMVKEAIIQRLNISSSDYMLCDSNLLSESDLLYFRSIVKRLLTHEPFQYIIGKTEFFGLEFNIDSRALIPRPETEELVQWISEEYLKEQDLKIVDICTGSGCIALALKSHFPKAIVFATDLSKEALDLTLENSEILKLSIQTSLLDATKVQAQRDLLFSDSDIWVSNPPYIPYSDQSEMLKNVLEFEPHMALFVGNEDPLLFYREIGKNALKNLKSGGKVFFELHENLSKETEDLLAQIGFVNIELRKDLQGKVRMIMGQKP